MHFNDLGYEVLYRIFDNVALEHDQTGEHSCYKQLIDVSSVCRYWRAYAIQHIHKTLAVSFENDTAKSNAELIVGGGCVNYTQVLKVNVEDEIIENMDLVAVFEDIGVGKAIWRKISKLEILNRYLLGEENEGSIFMLAIKIKAFMNFLAKHVPELTTIEYTSIVRRNGGWKVEDFDFEDLQLPCMLLSELVRGYSAQLDSLCLGLPFERIPFDFVFPQGLSQLAVDMDNNEQKLLSTIFAPSLQKLSISRASSDITWNWFNEDDGSEVWFSSLKEIAIKFNGRPSHSPKYHNCNLIDTDIISLDSQYHKAAKKVHFPVLESVETLFCPYDDDSFFMLFKDCPLKRMKIWSPRRLRGVLPEMVANLSSLSAMVDFKYSYKQYYGCISKLISASSTAHSVHLRAIKQNTISLPSTLGWTSTRKLRLDLKVDMPSVFTILAQMTNLQTLRFMTCMANLNKLCCRKQTSQQFGAVNKSVEHMLIYIEMDEKPLVGSFKYCLTRLLTLTPSLLKLKINHGLVNSAKEAVSDPANSLERMSDQLEIISW